MGTSSTTYNSATPLIKMSHPGEDDMTQDVLGGWERLRRYQEFVVTQFPRREKALMADMAKLLEEHENAARVQEMGLRASQASVSSVSYSFASSQLRNETLEPPNPSERGQKRRRIPSSEESRSTSTVSHPYGIFTYQPKFPEFQQQLRTTKNIQREPEFTQIRMTQTTIH